MSQVIKAQNGTKTPEAKKSKHDNRYGHYIVDGVTYDVNDDFLRDYANSAKQYNDNSTSILANDILNTLRSGKDVSINTLNNSISGVDNYSFDNKDIAKSQELNQAGWTRKTQRIARRNANRNSSLHQFHQGIKNLGNIQFTDPVGESQTSTQNQSLPALFSTRNLDYDQDEKGNWIWSTGPQNAGNLQAINNIWRFLDASNEDAAKMYDTSGYETNVSDLRAWRDTNKNFDRNAFIERIKTNQLTNADWDLLSSMGFNRFDFSKGKNQSEQQTTIPRSPEDSRFDNNALTRAGFYIQQGNDGNYYLLNSDGSIYNTPWYLRDEDLFKGTQWEGGSIVGGRLYTQDQTFNQDTDASRTIQALINVQGREGTPEEIFQAMKNTGIRFAGSNLEHSPYIESFNRDKNTLKGFDDVFLDGDYYIRDLTASYNIPQNYNGLTILSYLNRNNGRDYDQRLREQYAIYDPNNQGQYQRIYNNIEDLQSYLSKLGVTNQTGIQTPHRLDIQNYILHPEDGRRLIQSDDDRSVIVGEGDQAMTFDIYRDNDGTYYARGLNNNIIPLLGSKILEKIKNGTVTHNEMLRGYADEDRRGWLGRFRTDEWITGRGTPKRNYNVYEPGSYDDYFRFKNGGKIPILQYGGKTLTAQSIIDRDKESKDRVGQASKAFGAQKSVKTSADKWAKAAGILDTTGAAATIIAPGYGNIAGAVTGLAGSIARFVSDTKRDGLDWGDARRLLTNIGLDALTLIPGAGTAAKAAKIGKAVKSTKVLNSVGKVLRNTAKPLSVAGAAGGIATAAGAIANGDGEFTSEDFAQLGQGLLGAAGGFKNIRQLNKEARLVKEIAKDIKLPNTKSAEELKKLPWLKRQFAKASNTFSSGRTASANELSARGLSYKPWKQDELLDAAIKDPKFDLKKLATDKSGKLDEQKLEDIQNIIGRRLAETGKIDKNNFVLIGERVNPWWFRGNQFTSSQRYLLPQGPYTPKYGKTSPAQSTTSQPLVSVNNPPVTTQNNKPVIAGLLPRGDGKFFSKTQRVWGGIAHQQIPIKSSKYSKTPRSSEFRNIGLEQAYKQRILTEAGKQQVPAIRGLQEDIASVKTSEDFKNLLIKINNRDSYKEIIKNNPEFKDQLREMFIHLGPVRLGNWMTKYNLRFKKGGKIVKAESGTKLKPNTFQENYNNGSGMYTTWGFIPNYQHVFGGGDFGGAGAFSSWKDSLTTQNTNLNGKLYTANRYGSYLVSVQANKPINQFNNPPAKTDSDDLSTKKETISTSKANNESIPTLNGGTLDETTVTADKLALPTFSPYATTQMSQTALDIPTVTQTSNLNPVVDADSSETKSKETGIQTREKSQWLSNLKINPDDLIAATELARSITANNRMFRDLQDANKAVYKDMPIEIYDRYQDHITPIYNEMAQRQRSYVPVSTDQLTNYAIRQSRQDAADQMEAEGKLKASEVYNQYLANDLAARRAYAEDRRNTAFYNRQMAASKVMRDAEIDQMRRLANNQSISNAVMEFRNKLNLDRNKKEAFMQQRDAIQAKNKYDEIFNNALNEWITKWNNDPNKANYASAEEYWMDKNMASYTDAITKARNAGLMTNQNNWNNYMWYHRINPIDLNASTPVTMTASRSYKSGGKTSAQYTRRHYGPKPDEAIWIQHNKATAEAIKQLRDSVIKLFMLNLK